MNDATQRLMSREEAAAYLGVNPQTLAKWHSTGSHQIPVKKVGRLCKYSKSDLDAWLESRTQTQVPG